MEYNWTETNGRSYWRGYETNKRSARKFTVTAKNNAKLVLFAGQESGKIFDGYVIAPNYGMCGLFHVDPKYPRGMTMRNAIREAINLFNKLEKRS